MIALKRELERKNKENVVETANRYILATSKGASCFEIVLSFSRSIKEASIDFTLLCEGI